MPLLQSLDPIRFTFPGASRFAALSALPLAITFPRLWRSRKKQFHNLNSLHFESDCANLLSDRFYELILFPLVPGITDSRFTI